MTDPASLANSQVTQPEPELREAVFLDNATDPDEEIRCIVSSLGKGFATDPLAWEPHSTATGTFYPKKEERAVLSYHLDGPPVVVWWEPDEVREPDVAAVTKGDLQAEAETRAAADSAEKNAREEAVAAEAAARAAADAALAVVPVGTILATAGSSAPTGYLLCEGQAVNRTTFKPLFEVIGTTFGAGNGSTTFNVPDLRGRVPVGVDGSAGRLGSNDALGSASGAENHTLTTEEMPSHGHSAASGGSFVAGGAGSGANVTTGGGSFVTTTITATGGGKAHRIMQPYQVVNYMVKT